MIKYSNFMNEAKTTKAKPNEPEVGDFFLCQENMQNIRNIKGRIAEITEIEVLTREDILAAQQAGQYVPFGQGTKLYNLRFDAPIEIMESVNRRNKYGQWVGTVDWVKADSMFVSVLRGLKLIPKEYIESFKKGTAYEYVASPFFNNMMKSIKFKMKNFEFVEDMSFFDIDKEKDNLLTFLPLTKLKLVTDLGEDYEGAFKSRYRQAVKLGTVFKKLNPDLTDAEIEKYVIEYRAIWKAKMEHFENRLKVVTGEDIRYWYLRTRYAPGGGSLNSSCMQGKEAQSQLDFYVENPNRIALAILLSDDDKLFARALVWRTDQGIIFMDRIYSVKPEHEKMLLNFAEEHGMVQKNKFYGGNLYGGGRKLLTLKLDKPYRKALPYLDTMSLDSDQRTVRSKG
jgi:hypothetical protein